MEWGKLWAERVRLRIQVLWLGLKAHRDWDLRLIV